MNETVAKKIEEYEHFINDTLKKDLQETQSILDSKLTKYSEWEEVKQVVKVLEEFKTKDRDMQVQFELGSSVRAFGEVSDYERTYVSVGLGYMLEMNSAEADKYADIRLRLLKKEIDHLRDLAVNIKVRIKLVLLGINELQNSLTW